MPAKLDPLVDLNLYAVASAAIERKSMMFLSDSECKNLSLPPKLQSYVEGEILNRIIYKEESKEVEACAKNINNCIQQIKIAYPHVKLFLCVIEEGIMKVIEAGRLELLERMDLIRGTFLKGYSNTSFNPNAEHKNFVNYSYRKELALNAIVSLIKNDSPVHVSEHLSNLTIGEYSLIDEPVPYTRDLTLRVMRIHHDLLDQLIYLQEVKGYKCLTMTCYKGLFNFYSPELQTTVAQINISASGKYIVGASTIDLTGSMVSMINKIPHPALNIDMLNGLPLYNIPHFKMMQLIN